MVEDRHATPAGAVTPWARFTDWPPNQEHAKNEKFDASRYLATIKDKQYLPDAARLLYFRHGHPDAAIETELVNFTAEVAVVKATVRIPNGGSATGYGSETPQGFTDYPERAETRAIGQALGALGFGTQFAGFEEGEHVVESPVQRLRPAAPQRPAPRQPVPMAAKQEW